MKERSGELCVDEFPIKCATATGKVFLPRRAVDAATLLEALGDRCAVGGPILGPSVPSVFFSSLRPFHSPTRGRDRWRLWFKLGQTEYTSAHVTQYETLPYISPHNHIKFFMKTWTVFAVVKLLR